MLKFCLGRYKTQEIFYKAVGKFLPTLKFVLNLFVTNEMLKTDKNRLDIVKTSL